MAGSLVGSAAGNAKRRREAEANAAAAWRLVLWAFSRHLQHPQFRDGSWLPEGWIEWATHMGYRPYLSQSVIEA